MVGEKSSQTVEQTESIRISDNILRILTMLEKALNRLLRHNYYNRSQYPQIVQEIEEALNKVRTWIHNYKNYACLRGFNLLLGLAIKDLTDIIGQLMTVCKPLNGKKQIKKTLESRTKQALWNNCFYVGAYSRIFK